MGMAPDDDGGMVMAMVTIMIAAGPPSAEMGMAPDDDGGELVVMMIMMMMLMVVMVMCEPWWCHVMTDGGGE